MARPGQKRKRLSGRMSGHEWSGPSGSGAGWGGETNHHTDTNDDDDDDDPGPVTKVGQALPVADLPDDYTGEPSDGATYLALSIRANASLPFSKRVAVPAHLAAPDTGVTESVTVIEAGRHPALPRESWVVLFAAHWRAYRAHLAAHWPGEMLPYPPEYPSLPSAGDAPRWLAFINGVPMGKPSTAALAPARTDATDNGGDAEDVGDGDGDDADMELDGSDDDDGGGGAEEEAMNAAQAEEEAMNDAAPEPSYPPREPLVGVLQRMSTDMVVRVLKHLTRFTRVAVERLRDGEVDISEGDALPPAHARWAFALLGVLEEHLGGDDVSVLREFARVAADAALCRWEVALKRGEIKPVVVREGFYGQGSAEEARAEVIPVLGEQGGKEGPAPPGGYLVGARWKALRDARARSDATPRPESAEAGHDPGGLDEALARAWTCAHAVVAGWAQWDLVDDFEALFRGVPRI